jgi:hypothetical protein
LYGLVQTSDRLIHRVVTGNYLGQNDGRIISITDSAIQLLEIIPDGLGDMSSVRPPSAWVRHESRGELSNDARSQAEQQDGRSPGEVAARLVGDWPAAAAVVVRNGRLPSRTCN